MPHEEPPLRFEPDKQTIHQDPWLVRWIEQSPQRIKWATRTVGTLVLVIAGGIALLLHEPSDVSRFRSLLKKPLSSLNKDEQAFTFLQVGLDITDVQRAFHIGEVRGLDEYGNTVIWQELQEKFGINTPEELFANDHFKTYLLYFRIAPAIPVAEREDEYGRKYFTDVRTGALIPVK